MSRCLFVTGTDTGVGKTVLTCLLLRQLREEGVHALAMKPFCSGGREDVDLLREAMDAELSPDEINPWFFPEPVAPLASSRKYPALDLKMVLEKMDALKQQCDLLLVEGAGGVCVPVTNKMTVLDVVRNLACDVVLVSANKLGTINHTLLSAMALNGAGISRLKIVLMEQKITDESAKKNAAIIQEFLPAAEVMNLEFCDAHSLEKELFREVPKKIKKTLARVADFDTFSTSSLKSGA